MFCKFISLHHEFYYVRIMYHNFTNSKKCFSRFVVCYRATHMFSHQQLGIVGQHNFPIEQLDVSGNGELLASISHDNTIKFWNIKYLEDIKVSDRDKMDKKKILTHNLPSSKVANPGDFFADMA